MDNVLALKQLFCAIKNDGTTADQISGDTVVDVINQMTIHYGGSIGGDLGELTLTSLPGTEIGTTKITITETVSGPLKYKTGGNISAPAYGQDINSWDSWDGSSDIEASDGTKICVAEVNAEGQAISGGVTTVNANIGE